MSLEHDYSNTREFYKDLKRGSQEPVDPETTARREGIAFQKWYDWQIRQRMLPTEILAASNARSEEVNFLLGGTDTDPDPSHQITYHDLVDSGEEIILPEIDVHRSILSRIRVPKQKDERPILQRIKLAQVLDGDRLRTFTKQIKLSVRVEELTYLAFRASDLTESELHAIEGIRDENGNPILDPNPDHLPKYRRLVSSHQEAPIFET